MIYALTVTRNEAGRFLPLVLSKLNGVVDGHFVFDDQSTDGTVDLCLQAGASVTVRAEGTPSFADSEGAFRQAAWDAFEETVGPSTDDWVLSIDADEIPVSTYNVREQLHDIVRAAHNAGMLGVRIPIPEVWEVVPAVYAVPDGYGVPDHITPLGQNLLPRIRVDGEWGRQKACRLFPYHHDGDYRQRERGLFHYPGMGAQHAPTYVYDLYPPLAVAEGFALLHLGYLNPADRQAKYDRYARTGGHSAVHVRSILQQPILDDWTGGQPSGGWA